jgi:hypothetical protein
MQDREIWNPSLGKISNVPISLHSIITLLVWSLMTLYHFTLQMTIVKYVS